MPLPARVTPAAQRATGSPEWSMPRRASSFRSDIEGLRGIAILTVVLFHCGLTSVSGGFMGVDVFFVLSGFLITGLLVHEVQTTSHLDLLGFYARRARRLLPAFALTVVSTLFIGALLLGPLELDRAGHAGRATALYMSNIFFDKIAGDYFRPDIQSNPFLHTWSLALEEQFYLLWPLLIVLTQRWWGSLKELAGVLGGLIMLSLAAALIASTYSRTFAFYELPARAWEFGIGALAAIIPSGRLQKSHDWWRVIGWVGFLTLLSVVYFFRDMGDVVFPGWVALLPTLATAAVLIAGSVQPTRGVGTLLAVEPLQILGKLSYSWYLWHWPCLIFASILYPSLSSTGKLFTVAIALGIAGLSYHLVERPIRFHPSFISRPTVSLALGGLLTVCVLSVAFLSMGWASQLAKDPAQSAITAASHDLDRFPRKDLCSPPMRSAEVKTCQFGEQSAGIHIVLFGDSHAIHWFNPLEQLAETNRWKLTTVVKRACTAFDLGRIGEFAEYNAACAQWRAEALRHIVTIRPTLVVLANSTSYMGRKNGQNPPPSLDQLQEGTRRTLQALAGVPVLVLRDTPNFPYDIPTCLARVARHERSLDGACQADRSAVLNPTVFEAEQAAAQEFSSVHVLDLTDLLCSRTTCDSTREGTVVYRDNEHLTGTFATQQMPALALALDALLHEAE